MRWIEYPDGLWTQSNPNWSRWLPGLMPATFTTYAQAVEYYAPFVQALDSAVWYSHFYPDTTPPTAVSLHPVTALKDSAVYLRWSPQAFDVAFDSYLIYYDPAAITPSSPRISRQQRGLHIFEAAGIAESTRARFSAAVTLSFCRDQPRRLGQYALAAGFHDRNLNGLIPEVTTFLLPPDSIELNWLPQAGTLCIRFISPL